MSRPFLLASLLFIAVLADRWTGPTFVSSLAYRQMHGIALGLVIVGLLLWVWVLAASRQRETRFDGPVQTVRGRSGALQPVLATVMIVVTVNLAYSHSLPRLINSIVTEDVRTAVFTIESDVAASAGCERVTGTSPDFGTVPLCLPEGTAGRLDLAQGGTLEISGWSSWFGIQPGRYAARGALAEGADAEPEAPAPPAPTVPRTSLDKLQSI